MRSIIAQRMVESKHTSPHVHTCFKIDLTKIVKLHEKEKSKYEQRNGVKLTYMPFITRAVINTLRKMPIVNASMEGDGIRYHKNVNIGIAVALDWGLIVPVIKEAEDKSFLGVARAIVDLAERARGKKLKPDEVSGGTFTITNPGIFGDNLARRSLISRRARSSGWADSSKSRPYSPTRVGPIRSPSAVSFV